MTNTQKQKSLDEMTPAEIQAELNEYLQALQSGGVPPAPAGSTGSDPRGEALMKMPINKISAEDQAYLRSEIHRVLKEGW